MSFILTGRVVGGKRIGRTLGFPTANIAPDTAIGLPKNGVYVALVTVPGVDAPLLSVLNQGVHPTLPEGRPTIEAYILDFDRDIYGERVTVEYLRYLRPEYRFASADDLVRQMVKDVAAARETVKNG